MSIPWVSREAYNAAIEQRDGANARAIHAESQVAYFKEVIDGCRADLGAERERYKELFQSFMALKLVGTQPGQTPVFATPEAVTPLKPAERDELKELIGAMCGSDSRKRGMMLKALAADRAANVPDEKIRHAIEFGVQSEGVPL